MKNQDPPCSLCAEVIQKANNLPTPIHLERSVLRLLKRAVVAGASYFRKPKAKIKTVAPRFLCLECDIIIPAENVKVLPTVYPSSGASSASSEVGLPTEHYSISCHGEEMDMAVSIAMLMMSHCHINALFPNRYKTWEPQEEDIEVEVRYPPIGGPEVERHQARLQKEIAEANERREQWMKTRNLHEKIAEMQEIIDGFVVHKK
jgi:hypothetical protein